MPHPSKPTTRFDEVVKYVNAMLGYPKQRVELVEDHYIEAMNKALYTFNRYIPKRKTGVVKLTQNVYAYPLDRYGKGLINVEIFRQSEVDRELGRFDDHWLLFGPGRLYWPTNGGYHSYLFDNIGYYEWAKMHLETIQRITSNEVAWRFEDGVLYITNHDAGSAACYTYVDDYELDEIPKSYVQWVKDYTLAICKTIIGTIRSRFSSIPAPGGDIVQNGDSLKAEGQSDMDKLTEDLKTMAEDLGVYWG